MWVILISVLAILLAIELFVVHRRPRALSAHGAAGWAALYALVAAGLNVGIFFAYRAGWMGGPGGHEKASVEFLSCYLLELALSLDSTIALAAIFTHFDVPSRYRRLILLYGAIPALIVRGAIIFGGSTLVGSYEWFKFVLAGMLVLALLRMVVMRRENTDPEKNWIHLLLRKWLPSDERFAGGSLLTSVDGRVVVTKALTVLLLIETADGIFAFDSLPGVFAFCRDPVIIFAAHATALLTYRAMYFAIEPYLGAIRFVKVGLALLLAYTAVAVALPRDIAPSPEVSLAVLSGTVLVGFIAAAAAPRTPRHVAVGPLGEDADRVARAALRQARRVGALIVGSAIVLVGLVMIPGPGPGLLVVPIGLAVLAVEFVWARTLLDRYRTYAMKVGTQATERLTRTPRPWLIPIVIGGTVLGAWALAHYGPFPTRVIIGGIVPLLIGQTVWAVVTVKRYRRLKADAAKNSDGPSGPAAPL